MNPSLSGSIELCQLETLKFNVESVGEQQCNNEKLGE